MKTESKMTDELVETLSSSKMDKHYRQSNTNKHIYDRSTT